jgi:hypothetical protein
VEKHESQRVLEDVFSEQDINNIKGPLGNTDDGVTIDALSDKKNSLQERFDGFLIEAIDEALTSLGAPVKNTIYFQLENSFNISKSEIPQQIDEFLDIMHKIFGLSASRLETKFLKNLHSKINVDAPLPEYEWPLSKWIIMDMSFKECLCNMRRSFEVTNNIEKKKLSKNTKSSAS